MPFSDYGGGGPYILNPYETYLRPLKEPNSNYYQGPYNRAPKEHISKNKDRDISYAPLIMKPHKVGISL